MQSLNMRDKVFDCFSQLASFLFQSCFRYAEKHVLLLTHHLILSFLMILEADQLKKKKKEEGTAIACRLRIQHCLFRHGFNSRPGTVG